MAEPLPLTRPYLPPLADYEEDLRGLWQTRMLSNFASATARLEEAASGYFATPGDHPRVLCTSSADIGLTLAIAALEVEPECEAIVPSFTHCSTVNATLWNRLRPRFVDIDPESWCLDPEALEAALTPRTGLIVATHALGLAAPVSELEAIAARAGVPLLADAAPAIATLLDGRHVSHYADATVFSLGATKLIGTAEGGLVSFARGEAAERFRLLRQYGHRADYESVAIGLNGKLSEPLAALGILTFRDIDAEVKRREALLSRYRRRLAGRVGLPHPIPGGRPSPTYMPVLVPSGRDEIAAELGGGGIATRPYYRALHRMDAFASISHDDLPATERLSDSVLCLPLFGSMTEADVDRVCSALEAALDGHG